MQIVDAHHHLWDPRLLAYPWLAPSAPNPPFGDKAPIAGPYLPADYATDAHGLDLLASVHVQAECAPSAALDETRWLAAQAPAMGRPFVLVVRVDPRSPDLDAELAAHEAAGPVRGVRLRVNFDLQHGRSVIDDPAILSRAEFADGLRRIAARGWLFELSLFPSQMEEAAQLCAAVPELTFVVNHLGWPLDVSRDGFLQWRSGMRLLARLPNVVLKISGLWPIDRVWNRAALALWVETAVELFGPARCLYGSNLPIERSMCAMARQVETLQAILSTLSPDESADLFGRTCRRLYRF